MGPFRVGWTKDDVDAVLAAGNPDDLLYVPIVISMSTPDPDWSQELCIELSAHPHFNVRGNAILGFGHLARVTGSLDRARVEPLVRAALQDINEFVRGQAESAKDDLKHYLGWDIGE